MSSDKFEPLLNALKSKFNLVVLVLGIILLFDLYFGSPLMKQLILLQLKIRKVDPNKHGFTIITIFGRFSNINALACFFDKSLCIAFFIICGFSYIRGLLVSLLRKM